MKCTNKHKDTEHKLGVLDTLVACDTTTIRVWTNKELGLSSEIRGTSFSTIIVDELTQEK